MSPFTETKQYYAQFGFLYLIRDYYPIIKERYATNTELLQAFQSAFSKSIRGLLSYYQQRDNWYNPMFKNLVCDILKDKMELLDGKLIEQLAHDVESVPLQINTDDNLSDFLDKCIEYIQKEHREDYSLRFGYGGDLLFLFYAFHVERQNVDVRYLQILSGRIFKHIKLSVDKMRTLSYWDDIVGLVQVLELLDQNELADTDIKNVFRDFDQRMLNLLIQQGQSNRDTVLAANTLLSRLRHYQRDDGLVVESQIVFIQIAEDIIKRLESSNLNIYAEDLSIEIDWLHRLYIKGLYMEPIQNALESYRKRVIKYRNAFTPTVAYVNNICAVLDYMPVIGENHKAEHVLNKKLSQIKLEQIPLDKSPYYRITHSYLVFLNRLIDNRGRFDSSKIDAFIKSRLEGDISFVFQKENEQRNIHGGIIGLSGIALTVLSYLHPEVASSWNKIILVR